MLEHGMTADLCINGEPTDLAVMTSHSGVTQVKLIVHGKSAHVSQRNHGINAIDKLVRLLPEFREDALTFTGHPEFPGLPTINVGVIRGGSLPSMLAARAEAMIDVRTVPGMSPHSVLEDLERMLSRARERDPGLAAELRLSTPPGFCQQRPFHMQASSPVIQAVARAHQAVTGSPAVVGTLVQQVFFGTDASHILAAGIPVAIYGPGKVTDINTPNESMAIADILTAARVYLASVFEICGEI
jgi:acetylornithine deacetylase